MLRAVLLGTVAMMVIPGRATVWTIGPGQTYTMPSQVSALVGNGDTVNIEAGVYPSDVARWQADDLVLRGIGGFAHLESNGQSWGGKAIWVIQGDNCTVEWIEFSECQVPDHNGAGIRLEGLNLSVSHCWFHHNENGILCGEYHPSTVRIEYSEFGHHGYGDGYSHNLYIGHIDSLIFRYNYNHHADVGHELKSRAWVNVIEYNRFSNESDGTASREIDLPNGGQAYLIGNVIQQGLQSQNSNMVGFGMEGLSNPGPHELYAVNNTLVNEKANGSFFQMPTEAYFKATSNILAGGGSFMSTWPTTLDTLANLRSTSIAALQFLDAANYDLRIDVNSPAHNTGFPAGLANNGYPLVALWEYAHPTNGVLRCQHALLDAGAFETCTTGTEQVRTNGHRLFPNPAHDHVQVYSDEELYWVHVQDVQGRTLRLEALNGDRSARIDLTDLPSGMLILRITGPSGVRTERFVKN